VPQLPCTQGCCPDRRQSNPPYRRVWRPAGAGL